MDPFGSNATILAAILSSALSIRAFKRESLTGSGSIAAFIVSFLLVGSGLRGMNLLTFYAVSMKATKFKKEYKASIDGSINPDGNAIRGASQVLSCSLLAAILSLFHTIYYGPERVISFDASSSSIATMNNALSSKLTCGIIAHHATCLADTLASEMGILSKSSPRLITQPWITVPSGTNGGVTVNGFIWSIMGGLIIGVSTVVLDLLSGIIVADISRFDYILRVLLFSSASGLAGSVIDSLLGATIQQSFFDPDSKKMYQEEDRRPKSAKLVNRLSMNILTNELVNSVSVAVTTIIGGWVFAPFFFL